MTSGCDGRPRGDRRASERDILPPGHLRLVYGDRTPRREQVVLASPGGYHVAEVFGPHFICVGEHDILPIRTPCCVSGAGKFMSDILCRTRNLYLRTPVRTSASSLSRAPPASPSSPSFRSFARTPQRMRSSVSRGPFRRRVDSGVGRRAGCSATSALPRSVHISMQHLRYRLLRVD